MNKDDSSMSSKGIKGMKYVTSVKMSRLLRHQILKEKFNILEGGYISLDELLNHKAMATTTKEFVLDIVKNDKKQRFDIKHVENGQQILIRANQGHSCEVNIDFDQILNSTDYPSVIHGTFLKHINAITLNGIHRMKRTHIHFANGLNKNEQNEIAGIRKSCEVYIFIDLEKAMKDGILFYISKNNVILTKGDENGFIRPKYFTHIINRMN